MKKLNPFQFKCVNQNLNIHNLIKLFSFDSDDDYRLFYVVFDINGFSIFSKITFSDKIPYENLIDFCYSHINKRISGINSAFIKHVSEPKVGAYPDDNLTKMVVIKNLCKLHNEAVIEFYNEQIEEWEDIPPVSEKIIEYLFIDKKINPLEIFKHCSIYVDFENKKAYFSDFIQRIEDIEQEALFKNCINKEKE